MAMVVAALVPIAIGISVDFYVVTWKISQSVPVATGLAAALFVLFVGLWFGLSLLRRLSGADRRELAAHPA